MTIGCTSYYHVQNFTFIFQSDVPTFETEIGGIFNRDLVNRNAPFGTHYTPSLRTKIVGGKPLTIQETQR